MMGVDDEFEDSKGDNNEMEEGEFSSSNNNDGCHEEYLNNNLRHPN